MPICLKWIWYFTGNYYDIHNNMNSLSYSTLSYWWPGIQKHQNKNKYQDRLNLGQFNKFPQYCKIFLNLTSLSIRTEGCSQARFVNSYLHKVCSGRHVSGHIPGQNRVKGGPGRVVRGYKRKELGTMGIKHNKNHKYTQKKNIFFFIHSASVWIFLACLVPFNVKSEWTLKELSSILWFTASNLLHRKYQEMEIM